MTRRGGSLLLLGQRLPRRFRLRLHFDATGKWGVDSLTLSCRLRSMLFDLPRGQGHSMGFFCNYSVNLGDLPILIDALMWCWCAVLVLKRLFFDIWREF